NARESVAVTLALRDALPIWNVRRGAGAAESLSERTCRLGRACADRHAPSARGQERVDDSMSRSPRARDDDVEIRERPSERELGRDRKSTRHNSNHHQISYAD